MSSLLNKINQEQLVDQKDFALRAGCVVRVWVKVVEGDRERLQAFEGTVIAIRRRGANSSFTVRKISGAISIERVFPMNSPMVDRVEVLSYGRIRQAKPYYLRSRFGRAARVATDLRSRVQRLRAGAAASKADQASSSQGDAA